MRDTIENSNLIKFYDEIIDPRMIYLDRKLKTYQIEFCNKNFSKIKLNLILSQKNFNKGCKDRN